MPLGFLLLCLAVADTASAAPLFPIPSSVKVSSPSSTRVIDPSFSITSGSTNDVVTSAIGRYSKIVKTAASSSSDSIDSLKISVGDDSLTYPTLEMDVSYTLTVEVAAKQATISATTAFGALYGLETFSQLVDSQGSISGDGIVIEDEPSFRHRGITVDVGRRIAPIPLLESIIDGLSFTKMNVLHLSLTGPAVRIELDCCPELTAWLEPSQYYTKAQINSLVERARVRGVIIVPEIDIPAHSAGFWPLAETQGLQFCDANRDVLSDDAATMEAVVAVFDEIIPLFPSEIIHIGGDEALPKGRCTFQSIHALQRQIQEHIINVHNRTTMGWNEVFSSPVASEPNGAIKGKTILQNWKGEGDGETIGAGFVSVDSEYKQLYLNEQCCRVDPQAFDDPTGHFNLCYYVDVANSITAKQRANPKTLHMLSGGEAAMWSDEYCPSPLCPMNGTYGWMAEPSFDSIYVESFGKQVFPNTAATGAALWNYLDDTVLPMSQFGDAFRTHNDRLAERGVVTCPTGCYCDWGQSCGKAYGGHVTKPNLRAKIVNNCSFPLKVRAHIPCNHTNPTSDLAVIPPGGSHVVTDDFEVLGTVHQGHSHTLALGDPFNLWVGDSTWMDIVSEFHVTWSASTPTYLNYVQVGSSEDTSHPGMHVAVVNNIQGHKIVYIKAASDESGRLSENGYQRQQQQQRSGSVYGSVFPEWFSSTSRRGRVESNGATLCTLRVFNSSCLVRGNFIAEILDPATGSKVVAASDKFSDWWGDASYKTANATLSVTQDAKTHSYLNMKPVVW